MENFTSYREQFEHYNEEELKERQDELQFAVDNIEHQLELDEALAQKNEREKDPVWRAKANHAVRTKSRKVEVINDLLEE